MGSTLQDTEFVSRWVGFCNEDPRFYSVMEWFDGSILVDDEGTSLWLKVYRGKIIDRFPMMPPIGFTFKLSAKRTG